MCNKFKKRVLIASDIGSLWQAYARTAGRNRQHHLRTRPVNFVGSYAASKLMDEFTALAYYRTNGLEVVITRLFNTVGPRQTGAYGMVIPRFRDPGAEK